MRSVLALGLLVALCASTEAAAAHRSRPRTIHVPVRARLVVPLDRRVTPPTRFAVPGWTDEETRYWLDQATGPKG